MIRAVFGFLVSLALSAEGVAVAARSGDCAAAFAKLDTKIAQNLAAPPVGPVRRLTPDEFSIEDMSGGKPFEYGFRRYGSTLLKLTSRRLAVGRRIRFKASTGASHEIEIIAPAESAVALDEITSQVSQLPANVLEATKRIELRTFINNGGPAGFASRNWVTLNNPGLTKRTLSHEFGHNLATYIWGRANPYDIWKQAFQRDGSKYVSQYAKDSAFLTDYAEDFAEAVAEYLTKTEKFRQEFPNRAALLDTIFHNEDSRSSFAPGGTWNAIRKHNRRPLVQVKEAAKSDPFLTGLVVVVGASGSALYLLDVHEGDQ